MTMSKQVARATTVRDPYGWRASTVRVLANALLVLLVFGVVLVVLGVAHVIATGGTLPEAPVDGMPLIVVVAVFILARWILVLPVLLPVLIGLEYVNRRVSHARVLTTIVGLVPAALWALTQASSTWGDAAILGMTGVLYALVARLPARFEGRSTEDRGAVQPPAGPAVAPR
jgi:hypothetical protein